MTNVIWQGEAETGTQVAVGSHLRHFDWYPEEEGQLAVDVYQTETELIIVSTIAGVGPEDVEITLNNDLVTIRGQRQKTGPLNPEDYFYQECYWGSFSRSIVLPVEVDPARASSSLKYGLLTIILPKIKPTGTIQLNIREED